MRDQVKRDWMTLPFVDCFTPTRTQQFNLSFPIKIRRLRKMLSGDSKSGPNSVALCVALRLSSSERFEILRYVSPNSMAEVSQLNECDPTAQRCSQSCQLSGCSKVPHAQGLSRRPPTSDHTWHVKIISSLLVGLWKTGPLTRQCPTILTHDPLHSDPPSWDWSSFRRTNGSLWGFRKQIRSPILVDAGTKASSHLSLFFTEASLLPQGQTDLS
jgi:hypothetical protein